MSCGFIVSDFISESFFLSSCLRPLAEVFLPLTLLTLVVLTFSNFSFVSSIVSRMLIEQKKVLLSYIFFYYFICFLYTLVRID